MTDIIVDFPENWTNFDAAKKDVAEQIYYVSEKISNFEFENKGLRLLFSTPLSEGEADAINDSASQLMQKCSDASAKTKDEVLEEYTGTVTGPDDPLAELLKSGQLHFNSDGIPSFEGDLFSLLKGLDQLFLDYALEIGCTEQGYPTTVPTLSLLNNGYLKSFPQHAILAGTIHQDFESLTAIASSPEDYSGVKDVDSLISNHNQVLCPTVCYHCFERAKASTLKPNQSLITAIGKCHRHEGKNTQGLTRLKTYTMREIIYFGDKDFVRKWQLEILEKCKSLLREFDMTHRIAAASDPFFATSASNKKDFQRLFRLKYELQAFIPQEDKWISVASFNNHQQTLVQAYNIEQAEVSDGHSGCFGVGYERLAYALIAQKGISPSNWPDQIPLEASKFTQAI